MARAASTSSATTAATAAGTVPGAGPATTGSRAPSRGRRAALAATGVLALLGAGGLALDARDARRLEDARAGGAGGDLAGALVMAGGVAREPSRAAALELRAAALARLGREEDAVTAYRAAIAAAPNDWRLRSRLADLLLADGRGAAAARELARARALNPALGVPLGTELPRR